MDTTKQYIKMCEKAPKLQPHDLEFENGDYIYYKDTWGIYFNSYFYQEGVYSDENFIDYENNPFRLHSQDQLQKMVTKYGNNSQLVWFFNGWVRTQNISTQINDSMEQLWLAFVMKEKCNKTWNGEEWNV